jgi:UDP-GlcNAc:undecaprenyl-phosphate/decaprenyl-phosphate GlcNAc-1-phosphate transferase
MNNTYQVVGNLAMVTISAAFILSMALSLLLTPLASKIGRKYHVMDLPSERKVHALSIPRTGGGVFIFLYLTYVEGISISILNTKLIAFFLGTTLVFALGLTDDVRNINPRSKLAIQVVAASIAYAGGIRIMVVTLPGRGELTLGWFSLPITLFWFIWIINAINLVDGLDGLASGITILSSLLLLVICVTGNGWSIAAMIACIGLAGIGGSCLGFLRYNSNPASIFLGDSGSYVLGYLLAALSIMGFSGKKGAVAILMPLIILALPLMDALWAPIRRFLKGQWIFQADKDHFHHRLLRIGFSHRQAVLTGYCVTIGLGFISLQVR